MPFEINEGRTPPTVMFSMSRSTPGLEYNSPHNQPISVNTDQFKDVSNLKVNQRRSRSFTPVKGSLYLRSPELSPIDGANKRQLTPEVNAANPCESALEESLTPGEIKVLEQSLTPVEFKVPPPLHKMSEGTTPTRPFTHQHITHRRGEKTKVEDPNETQNLDKSASHGYLNHKLDVRLILKNAGMQQYIEAFDKQKTDFEKFLTLREEDLLRCGVERKVDRKVILSIINDLNSN